MRDALALARARGWWYRKNSDHTGSATLYCQKNTVDCCLFILFGTGRSPGGPARSFKRLIERCPHQDAENLPELDQAERLLDGAERIIDAIESLQHRTDLLERIDANLAEMDGLAPTAGANELLDVAESNLARIEELFDQAADWEHEARMVEQDAKAVLSAEGVHSEDPNSQVDGAEEVIREAEAVLDEVPRRLGRVARLRRRAVRLRDRVSVVRMNISAPVID
ncbi:hypothetical protein O7627_35200 [Solwaraspora sp. WMMD1047]|uniref:hypothetical protein n=1 Tax=Solwaraspora sp. WMMD1047 TaxID=3016102 RepID=UPI00241782F7|nr:hypothetical protein [Solwaraspora sp. WMMD1047]MDG4834518.1 hypothetical protein [Solwaraspora sp. WMMD1047]